VQEPYSFSSARTGEEAHGGQRAWRIVLESINSAAIRTIIAHQLRACTGSVGSGISELRIDYGPG